MCSLTRKNTFYCERREWSRQGHRKLFVGNIPLSFSNEDITKAVNKLGVQLRSKLFDAQGRHDRLHDGRLGDDLFLSQSRLGHCQRRCQ